MMVNARTMKDAHGKRGKGIFQARRTHDCEIEGAAAKRQENEMPHRDQAERGTVAHSRKCGCVVEMADVDFNKKRQERTKKKGLRDRVGPEHNEERCSAYREQHEVRVVHPFHVEAEQSE